MGKVILVCRRGKSPNYKNGNRKKKGPAKLRPFDFAEKHDKIRGIIKKIFHESGRGAPMCEVVFKNRIKFGLLKYRWVCVEGLNTGMYIECGKTAPLKPGNLLPLSACPEGTVISTIERHPMDRGRIARATGCSGMVVGHSDDGKKTRVRYPSGTRKTLHSHCRAVIGVVAGGGRVDKPLLKAGASHHKNKVKNKAWPRVRGVAKNPVEHPHGGGNHQHIGHPSTVGRNYTPGQKVGLVAARRTGILRGGKRAVKEDRA